MGPSYSDRRPLCYLPGQSLINERDALRVLAAVNTLESPEGVPASENGEAPSSEWQALHARYDLLLDMVGQLLLRDVNLPPLRDFEFTMQSLQWTEKHEIEPGEGRLQVFLHDAYPRPLTLPGKLTRLGNNEDGVQYQLQWDELGAPLRSELERHVFRHHRRAVARRQNELELEGSPPATDSAD